jgi:hypothetical protein
LETLPGIIQYSFLFQRRLFALQPLPAFLLICPRIIKRKIGTLPYFLMEQQKALLLLYKIVIVPIAPESAIAGILITYFVD